MRLFKVAAKSEYVDPKDGKAKHKWYQAGTLRITDAGAMFLRMHQHPDVQYSLFPFEYPSQANSEVEGGEVVDENTH
jgi:hypothetical protein